MEILCVLFLLVVLFAVVIGLTGFFVMLVVICFFKLVLWLVVSLRWVILIVILFVIGNGLWHNLHIVQ